MSSKRRRSSAASSRSSATCSAPSPRKPISRSVPSASSAGKSRPEPVGLERQLEQPLLAPGRLGDRSEHPGRDARGPGARPRALEHEHVEPALGRPPGAGEPDHAGADDQRVVLTVLSCHGRNAPLRAGGPDRPCAGITRIRFRRSAARRRPLSPAGRAPVQVHDTPLMTEGFSRRDRDRDGLLAARRRRLADARLYFVCEAMPDPRAQASLLDAVLAGGADLIQLRDKLADDETLRRAAALFRRAADRHGALFFLNDRPELVEACGADGVHVGQDDIAVADARAGAGGSALVGLSTHSPDQFDAALAAAGDRPPRPAQRRAGLGDADQAGPGRGRAGTGPARGERRRRGRPGSRSAGSIASNIDQVVAAGARRVVVVRALREAADPESAARASGLRSSGPSSLLTGGKPGAEASRAQQAQGALGRAPRRAGAAPRGDGRALGGAQRGGTRGARAARARASARPWSPSGR